QSNIRSPLPTGPVLPTCFSVSSLNEDGCPNAATTSGTVVAYTSMPLSQCSRTLSTRWPRNFRRGWYATSSKFPPPLVPDDGDDFVGWLGACASVWQTVCAVDANTEMLLVVCPDKAENAIRAKCAGRRIGDAPVKMRGMAPLTLSVEFCRSPSGA